MEAYVFDLDKLDKQYTVEVTTWACHLTRCDHEVKFNDNASLKSVFNKVKSGEITRPFDIYPTFAHLEDFINVRMLNEQVGWLMTGYEFILFSHLDNWVKGVPITIPENLKIYGKPENLQREVKISNQVLQLDKTPVAPEDYHMYMWLKHILCNLLETGDPTTAEDLMEGGKLSSELYKRGLDSLTRPWYPGCKYF